MDLFLMFLAGVLIGVAISMLIKMLRSKKPIAALRVDHSDPDGPYIFLELYEDIEELAKRKEALVEVKLKDYLPHN